MERRIRVVVIAATAVAALTGGAAIAGAVDGDDDASDTPISGQALGTASAAALEHTGGGKVTETEAGDEEGAYEVEVTRADGTQVDVHLDEDFNILGSVGDDDGAEDHDAGGDD